MWGFIKKNTQTNKFKIDTKNEGKVKSVNFMWSNEEKFKVAIENLKKNNIWIRKKDSTLEEHKGV